MFFEYFIVGLTKETVVLERELIARRQLLIAHATSKTVNVIDAMTGSHDKVTLVKALLALETLLAKQPNVVNFTIGLAVAHKTRTILVQIQTALDALQALGVPLEIGRYSEYVLIVYLIAAADTH
jgi:hypothetical protein